MPLLVDAATLPCSSSSSKLLRLHLYYLARLLGGAMT